MEIIYQGGEDNSGSAFQRSHSLIPMARKAAAARRARTAECARSAKITPDIYLWIEDNWAGLRLC
jgi:hypothetical protein